MASIWKSDSKNAISLKSFFFFWEKKKGEFAQFTKCKRVKRRQKVLVRLQLEDLWMPCFKIFFIVFQYWLILLNLVKIFFYKSTPLHKTLFRHILVTFRLYGELRTVTFVHAVIKNVWHSNFVGEASSNPRRSRFETRWGKRKVWWVYEHQEPCCK